MCHRNTKIDRGRGLGYILGSMRFLVACLVIFGLMPPLAAAAGAGADLARLLPGEIAGWKPAGEDRMFTRENIFDYMDGAGEIYLAFGFRQVLVRESSPRSIRG